MPINKPNKENKFTLPGSDNSQKKAKKDPVLTQCMMSKLRSANKYRKKHTTDLFSNEIFGIARSISRNSAT